MPHITDPETQLSHLQAAIQKRTCWVFLSDNPDGHLRMTALALQLAPSTEMDFGIVDYLNMATGSRRTISFLTIPKARVERQRMSALMNVAGLGATLNAEQDLIPVCGGGSHAELVGILEALVKGKVKLQAVGNN